MSTPYLLIRSQRRTLSIQIDTDGTLRVRAPLRLSIRSIEDFLEIKKNWIEKHQQKSQSLPKQPIWTIDEIRSQKKILKPYIIQRISELSNGKNLPKITSIKITTSEKRWGSCSGKNGLCFSYRLYAYMDSPFLDAIIIHELAHLIEKNHQKPFWNLVYSWMPDYESVIKNTNTGRGDMTEL